MVDLVHSNIGMYALMKHHHDQNNEHVYHLQRFSCAIFESQFSGFLAFQRLINLINFPCNSTLSMTVLIEQMAQFGRRLLDLSRTQSAKCSFLCLYLKLLMSSSVLSLFFVNLILALCCSPPLPLLFALSPPALFPPPSSPLPTSHPHLLPAHYRLHPIQPSSHQSSRLNCFLYFIL